MKTETGMIEVKENRKQYMDLLLLADEDEHMIEQYLARGEMYVMYENNAAIAECIVTDEGNGVLEIKSLAVSPEWQRKGRGKAMIDFVVQRYAGKHRRLRVGTGESPLTLPFYEKCGFAVVGRIKNFFTEHYSHPIVEAGVLLQDMILLEKEIKPCK